METRLTETTQASFLHLRVEDAMTAADQARPSIRSQKFRAEGCRHNGPPWIALQLEPVQSWGPSFQGTRTSPQTDSGACERQGVEGAVPGFGSAVDIVLRSDGDGGGRSGGVGGGPGRDLVAFDVEEMQTGAEGFADEQLKGALGGFQLVAFVLQLLDALEELATGVL